MACMVCSDFQAARTFLQPSTMAAHPRIDDTFGSVLIGTFVGLVMYGMSLQQALRYFRLYPTDSWRLKVTIAVLLLLDTMHMVEASHTCYYYLASYYFNPKAMLYGVWSIRLLGVTYGIIIIIVQSFYCLRISTFVPAYYKYLVMFLAPLLLAELGLVITAAVQETIVVTFVRWKHYAWIDVIFLVIALVVDTMLAGALVVILHKSRTGTTTQTESLLDVLITYTVNTCVLTSIANALTLIFIIASPNSLFWIGMGIPGARTYSIAMLTVLNSRKSLAKLANETRELGTFGLSDLQITVPGHRGTDTSPTTRTGTLEVSALRPLEHPPTHRLGFPRLTIEECESAFEHKMTSDATTEAV